MSSFVDSFENWVSYHKCGVEICQLAYINAETRFGRATQAYPVTVSDLAIARRRYDTGRSVRTDPYYVMLHWDARKERDEAKLDFERIKKLLTRNKQLLSEAEQRLQTHQRSLLEAKIA